MIQIRPATASDAQVLGRLNAQLIQDEGHRNPMSASELVERMRGWLEGEYQAVIVDVQDAIVAYALYRREPDHIYLRQLFVEHDARRRGVGRKIVQWLVDNVARDVARIRIEVLVGNEAAISFWKAIGFHDYCVTMEMELPKRTGDA